MITRRNSAVIGDLPVRMVVFYEPEQLTLGVVHDMLVMVGVKASVIVMRRWTDLERLLAYDWAVRLYLKASDNHVATRPRPTFVRTEWGG